MLDDFCSFVESIWGGLHKVITDLIGLKVLEIQNGTDMFHISLADKERFGKYSLYHRNYGKFLDGTYGWHLQCKCWTLSYAIVQAYGHFFHKQNGLWLNQEDYERLMADWRKYCEQIIQESSGPLHEYQGRKAPVKQESPARPKKGRRYLLIQQEPL